MLLQIHIIILIDDKEHATFLFYYDLNTYYIGYDQLIYTSWSLKVLSLYKHVSLRLLYIYGMSFNVDYVSYILNKIAFLEYVEYEVLFLPGATTLAWCK